MVFWGGALIVADRIKETTAQALNDLSDEGLNVVMATGDAQGTADAIGRELGINAIHGASPLRVTSRLSPQRNMRQNLWFAFLYNALGVLVAAGVLYPNFGWVLSPMVAALATSLSSVSVITNALR